MSQPPGDGPPDFRPPSGDPDDGPGRQPNEWPPMGPTPPGGPEGPSALSPPWRDAKDDEPRSAGLAVLGFSAAWLMVIVAVVFFFVPVGSSVDSELVGIEIALVLLGITGLFDLVWTIVGFTVKNHGARSFGYGVFIALLTHLVAGALGAVVLFGICVNSLNS